MKRNPLSSSVAPPIPVPMPVEQVTPTQIEPVRKKLESKNNVVINTYGADAILNTFKDILPSTIENEFKKLIKNGDEDAAQALVNTKIMPIIKVYFDRMNDDRYTQNEEDQWVHEVKKGVLKPKRVEKWAITNYRAYIYTDEQENSPAYFDSAGLAISEVVVMNQYRESNSSRVGGFVSRRGMGIYSGSGTSTSTSYGDLVFLIGGKEALRFRGISDPHGVKRVVDTLKKQTKV